MSRRLLLVEDEPALALALVDRLENEGWQVSHESDGDKGLIRAAAEAFDAILLDVTLPHRSGMEICRELRRRGIETPVLMITARGEVVDRVLGLTLGADDYLVKPFDVRELLARLEAVTRRRGPSSTGRDLHQVGDVLVDLKRGIASRSGEPLELSALEFRLLRYFLEHPSELLERERLLDEVWGYSATPVTRTVDVHVGRLRQKLEPVPSHPRHLLTVHGLGYRFEP